MQNQTSNRAIQGVVHGTAAFNGQAATGELDTGGLLVIESFSLTPIGTPAADENLSINETVNAQGQIVVADDRKVTVTRTGAVKTADLKVAYTLRGY